MNASRRIHLMWFFHQPFVVPNSEIAWRVDSTYLPLLDAMRERAIECSLGITGALLERCSILRPAFIDALSEASRDKTVLLLGTGAHHPFLPWLSKTSARAQIEVDRRIKQGLGLELSPVLWPPELAWSMRVGALAHELGQRAVVIDSGCRDSARTMPRWRETPEGLRPVVDIDRMLGVSAKIRTGVGEHAYRDRLELWVRERDLSNALMRAMLSEEEDDETHFQIFTAALEYIADRALDPEAPIVLAEDAERFLPNGYARFLTLLDSLIEARIAFVSPADFAASPCGPHIEFVPAGTREGDDSMWTATADDLWFRRDIDRITERVEAAFDLLDPNTDTETEIRDRLLRTQDSTFFFWHYVARTRTLFYSELSAIERLLREY